MIFNLGKMTLRLSPPLCLSPPPQKTTTTTNKQTKSEREQHKLTRCGNSIWRYTGPEYSITSSLCSLPLRYLTPSEVTHSSMTPLHAAPLSPNNLHFHFTLDKPKHWGRGCGGRGEGCKKKENKKGKGRRVHIFTPLPSNVTTPTLLRKRIGQPTCALYVIAAAVKLQPR